MSIEAGSNLYLPFQIVAADLFGNNGVELIAPQDGYIMELGTTVNGTVTTGGTINVQTGDALAVTVAGLAQTIANSAAKGARQATTVTKPSSTNFVAKGSRIKITPASFATAGSLNGYLKFNSQGV